MGDQFCDRTPHANMKTILVVLSMGVALTSTGGGFMKGYGKGKGGKKDDDTFGILINKPIPIPVPHHIHYIKHHPVPKPYPVVKTIHVPVPVVKHVKVPVVRHVPVYVEHHDDHIGSHSSKGSTHVTTSISSSSGSGHSGYSSGGGHTGYSSGGSHHSTGSSIEYSS